MSINDHDETPVDDVTLEPFEFDDSALDDWIAGGGITKHTVVMYGKPQLAAEYEHVEDELKLAKDRGLDEGSELAGGEVGALNRRLEEIHAEWAASRSRWLVRAIADDLIDEVDAAVVKALGGQPAPPKEPSKDAPKSKRDEYEAKKTKHDARLKAWTDRQNAELVMRVVEKIEFADGRVARVTRPEQVLKMRETFGDFQIMNIIGAARAGQMFSPELKAPFFSSTSRGDQT